MNGPVTTYRWRGVTGNGCRKASADIPLAQHSHVRGRAVHFTVAMHGTCHPMLVPVARHSSRGTTLLELALVLAVSLLIASALASLLNVHCKMLAVSSTYRFLSQQAPQLGLLLTKTMGNADDFRIYGKLSDAIADQNHVLTGPLVRLWMRQPDGAPRTAILSFATAGAAKGLCYYLAGSTGSFPASPTWKMPGGDLTNATFDDTTGILLVTLQGSNHDQLTFAAEKK